MLYLLVYKKLPFTGESGIPIIAGKYELYNHKYPTLVQMIKYILVPDPD